MTDPSRYFAELIDRSTSPTLVVRPRLRHRHEDVAPTLGPVEVEPVGTVRADVGAGTGRGRRSALPSTSLPAEHLGSGEEDEPPAERTAVGDVRRSAPVSPVVPAAQLAPSLGEETATWSEPGHRADHVLPALVVADTPADVPTTVEAASGPAPSTRLEAPLVRGQRAARGSGLPRPDGDRRRTTPTDGGGRTARRAHADHARDLDVRRNETPTVHVTIGRVEVRAVAGPTAESTASSPSSVLPLDEYLRQRARGRRS